ncbi:hypothetical protein [Streptomyces sp. AGS-58]|uniref:hypothetical protein n=1 Tax=unclassified Streptomyces TaxID=2593676 RepID=UPI0035A2946A
MRSDRFERLLVDAINADGRLTARTYAEAGFDRSPHGAIAATGRGAAVNVQIVGRLADGARHDHAEQPVTGEPHEALPVPDPAETGTLDLETFERYLAGLVVGAAPEEVRTVTLYRDRDAPGAVRYGATITYHDGAATFLYVLSAGDKRHEDFGPPAKVGA